MPSWGDREQSAPQQTFNPKGAAQTVAPHFEATPISTHTGLSAAVEPSAPSWGEGEHGEGKSTPNLGLFSWATATAAEISQYCGLDSLSFDLVEQVLPRFRAHLKKSRHSARANTCQTNPAQIPPPVALALPWTPDVERSELLPAAQLPAPFHAPEQPAPLSLMEYPAAAPTTVAPGTEPAYDPELWSMLDWSTWAPEPEPSTVAEPIAEPQSRTLAYEELEALLQEQEGAVLKPTVEEEPYAAPEFLLDLEHGRAVEARWEEHPFALPTREEVERSLCLPSNTHFSTELAQGAGMGGIWTGGLDFGPLPDGWEDWAELGCPEKM
jgi:hypothetical protein